MYTGSGAGAQTLGNEGERPKKREEAGSRTDGRTGKATQELPVGRVKPWLLLEPSTHLPFLHTALAGKNRVPSTVSTQCPVDNRPSDGYPDPKCRSQESQFTTFFQEEGGREEGRAFKQKPTPVLPPPPMVFCSLFYWSLYGRMTYTWTGPRPSGRGLIPG